MAHARSVSASTASPASPATEPSQRAFLVGLYGSELAPGPDPRLDELESLVRSAGARVAGRVDHVLRSSRDLCAATYLGRDKAHRVARLAAARDADLVVFDNELSPAQIRELEKIMGRRVIDRSEVILDIFALRARSREARRQVELAQLQYTAPRLRGMWSHFDRLANVGHAGVLGTRGPGEKQLEIDRRVVGRRVTRLRRELKQLHTRKQREVGARGRSGYCVGLVGYTNAGKSTLMNALTGAGVHVADELFATVDTRTRRWVVEPGFTALLSDTVGFVRELPHPLVASFRSTLEEARHANLLLHVIDASHPQAFEQIEAVDAVLSDLGCDPRCLVRVLNKVDRVRDPLDLAALRLQAQESVCISAERGDGLEELARTVARHRRRDSVWVRLTLPAGEGQMQARVRANAHIANEGYVDDSWVADVHADRSLLARLRHAGPAFVCEELTR